MSIGLKPWLALTLLIMLVLVSTPSVFSAVSGSATLPRASDLNAIFSSAQTSQNAGSDQGMLVSDLRSAVRSVKGFQTGYRGENLPGRSWSYLETGAPERDLINSVQLEKSAGLRNVSSGIGDSVELVIGVNGTSEEKYDELINRLNEGGGRFLYSVSIGNASRAIVADLPLSAVGSFASQSEKDGLAGYVEPNLTYKIDVVPNDPDWSKEWGMQRIGADWAWNTTVGDHSVLVAVVDTGIDYHHPDLVANYVALGYNWVDGDPNPMDDNGHGTHVAGVIAATLNNGVGISGLAQVRIMAEKALDSNGQGTSSDLANAIVHAVKQGAKIISCSWGSYSESALLHEAIRYAFENGALIVAAAGNDATSAKHYPAAFNEVLSVAATDESDNPASFSNFGDWIKVAAPGVNIYSTYVNDAYESLSGTSMATPHVSGVAALIWSRFPSMTRDQVYAQLEGTSDDLGASGFDIHYGYGRIDARNAVEQAPSAHDVLVLNLGAPSFLEPGTSTILNATLLNMGQNAETGISVQWLVNGSVLDLQSVSFLASGFSVALDSSWTPAEIGTYNITCYVVPLSGEVVVRNNILSGAVSVRNPQIIRVPQDYAKIQDAIQAALDGDTVSVAAGTYYENVQINKEGLRLVGEDQRYTIIDGGNRADVILVTANNVEISGFMLRDSLQSIGYAGIFVTSTGVSISNTTEINDYHGILLFDAAGATLRNNNMTDNVYNFGVEGDEVNDFIHDIDVSNTVDDRPTYYLVNRNGLSVPSGAGFVALVNCSATTVKDLQLDGNYEGLLLAGTESSIVENVSSSLNEFGIRLLFSSNNTCQYNNATANTIGVSLEESESNGITQNQIQNNEEGLYLYDSIHQAIVSNTLLDNGHNLHLQKAGLNTIDSNLVSQGKYGVYIEESTLNSLRNNSMTAATYNFGVVGASLPHFVQDIDISNTVDGRPVYYWLNQNSREVPTGAGYVGIVNSTNISAEGLNLSGNVQGVLLAYSSNCAVENISASGNVYGIYLFGSDHNTVILNTVASKGNRGVALIDSSDNTVGDNTILKSEIGIGSWLSSEDNDIVRNTVTYGTTGPGLYLDSSSNNRLRDNSIMNSYGGIFFYDSDGNTLRNNNMTGCKYSFGVYGVTLQDYINDVDTSNMINGKPASYLINQHDTHVPADAGYVAVVNSTGVIVKGLSLSNNEQSVLLAYSTGSTIEDVNVSYNYDGIYMWFSDANVISVSNVEYSEVDGISLYNSENNTILGCTISAAAFGVDLIKSNNNTVDTNRLIENNVGIVASHSSGEAIVNNNVTGGERSLAGIALSTTALSVVRRNTASNNAFFIGAGMYLEYASDRNSIFQNTFSGNVYGVSLGWWSKYGLEDQSNGNTIFHNNIINNAKQALSINSVNTWDNGYPSGGNHWSDYKGTDQFQGAYQNETGTDGIGDIQYSINENNTDRYPFLKRYVPVYGDLNNDGSIDIYDALKEASVFGTYPGNPHWSSDADFNQDGAVDIYDIIILTANFGKTTK